MNKWDVVLLSYPFTDLTSVKVRPAVVVSPTLQNQIGEDATFVLITSNVLRYSPFDLIVQSNDPEFSKTGLLKDSTIRVNKVMTLNKRMVIKTIGKLDRNLISAVEKCLRDFFELRTD